MGQAANYLRVTWQDGVSSTSIDQRPRPIHVCQTCGVTVIEGSYGQLHGRGWLVRAPHMAQWYCEDHRPSNLNEGERMIRIDTDRHPLQAHTPYFLFTWAPCCALLFTLDRRKFTMQVVPHPGKQTQHTAVSQGDDAATLPADELLRALDYARSFLAVHLSMATAREPAMREQMAEIVRLVDDYRQTMTERSPQRERQPE